MPTERVLKDVPTSEVETVVSDFESEGCEVEKVQQPDGKWTIKATCPDE